MSRKKVLVRRAKKDGKPIYKFHWQCADCSEWFDDVKEMEVDHIEEIGGVEKFNGDWSELIDKMFPRPVEKHLQVLCCKCHARKTGLYNSARSKFKRLR